MTMREHFETGSKKGRGRARRSLDLIERMYVAAKAAHPTPSPAAALATSCSRRAPCRR
jgi:hypothetical protein